MADLEAGLMEQGHFSLYASDGPRLGGLHLVLSPEGDTHRLIGLDGDGRRLRGQVLLVAGRLAAVQAVLPQGSHAVAHGRYRLDGLGGRSRIDFSGEELTADLGATPLTGTEGWALRVAPPAELAQRRALPAELRARWRGQDAVALDRPHALDYAGVRLDLVPGDANRVEHHDGWRPDPDAPRWAG